MQNIYCRKIEKYVYLQECVLTPNTTLLSMKKALTLVAIAASAMLANAETPLWMRYARISPDGNSIAFTYKGDIYTVPSNGGAATRLTLDSDYETSPVWSPDGSKIAYATDRYGNFDIFVIDATGGVPSQLTFNSAAEYPEAFSADGNNVIFSAYIQEPVSSIMYPTRRMTQLYAVPLAGGASQRLLGTPAHNLSQVDANGSFYYEDIKGLENQWRKHHTSSVSRDIWLYDATSGHHTNLTDRPGEDRNPVLSPDGNTLYFLSERNGESFNVWKAPANDLSQAQKLTSFATHPVRFLSISDNGTMAFTYDGELYTMRDGNAPQKVAVDILAVDNPEVARISVKGSGGDLSADGEQIVYAARGEIFVASVEHDSSKQITHTAAAESEPTWNPDNREIVYTSLRDGYYNIYSAKISRKDDPNFSNATIIDEKPVIAADGVERTSPDFSPDGKQLAFVQDRRKLMVMDTASGKVRQLTDGSTYPYRNGSFGYQWSPDSKWIVLDVDNNHHSPYTDIAIINVATGELTNITRSGYTDTMPLWAMDGNAIVFLSERYGMRNHASWGSQDDAFIIFLNREALDRYNLSEEDLALAKEAEKKAKKAKKDDADDKKSNKDKKSKKSDKDKADKANADSNEKDIVVELDGIEDRIRRLTPFSGNLSGAWVDNDGENLYYLMKVEDGFDLWKMDLREKEPKVAARIGGRAIGMVPSADGKTLFITGDKMRKIDVGSDKSTSISASDRMLLDAAAEREAMFERVVISEREQFYTPDLHGVDWNAMTDAYRRFLPHITNNYDFSEMLSELLGELNVSHTGSGYRGAGSHDVTNSTGSLCLFYDTDFAGPGLKVAEVIAGGPFDKASSKLRAGMIITSISGKDITGDVAPLLNNTVGKKTLISFTDPATGQEYEEVVIPVSSSRETALKYDRWVKQRAADVERWSGGRLGYIHIDGMSDEYFRTLYGDLLGKYNQCEGAVIDIRWNGGGRMHEDIEILLSGTKYLTQMIRGEEICDMPSRRYNKPTIMVVNEACYSNAHGTPWVYRNRDIGKIVGMPVPGTMTSVNWVTLQDPTLYFGIPVVGYQLADGSYLENKQLEPDVEVNNSPEDIVAGEDQQLRRAVVELLQIIDAQKASAK